MSLLARVIADSLNPILAALIVLEPLAHPRPQDPGWRFWGRAALGIGVSVLLAEMGKRHQIWPGHTLFPSGHETFALATLTFLVCRNRRWLIPAIILALLLAWALVAAHFHQPTDIVGALLVGPPIALLCDWFLAPKKTPH
jgi:membrane-associated phospholipid phosphatase